MADNAKNQLLELIQSLGCFADIARFEPQADAPSGSLRSRVTITFPDGRKIQALGEGRDRTAADIAAARQALNFIQTDHPDLLVDWEQIQIEAQVGDTLIKLGVYTSLQLNDAATKSLLLQKLESDAHLVRVFDKWKVNGDPDLAIWGPNMGEKRKATFIEALLWRRYSSKVLASKAANELHDLLDSLALE